jgi:hypothetical protein
MPQHSRFRTVLFFALQVFILLFGSWTSHGAVDITAQERAWLDANPDKLTLWYDRKFPPIEFESETGEFKGMAADIMRMIESQLEISFRMIPAPTWTVLLEALESGFGAVQ